MAKIIQLHNLKFNFKMTGICYIWCTLTNIEILRCLCHLTGTIGFFILIGMIDLLWISVIFIKNLNYCKNTNYKIHVLNRPQTKTLLGFTFFLLVILIIVCLRNWKQQWLILKENEYFLFDEKDEEELKID